MGRRVQSAAEVTAQAYLDRIGTDISADLSAGDRIGPRIVELDIAKCRLLADGALKWARNRERIQRELKILGIDENTWCKRQLGRSLNTMRGYRQVAREWRTYIRNRRKAGDCGLTGMDFAKTLVPRNARKTNSRKAGDDYEKLDISRITFITGDAEEEMAKLPDESVDVVPGSPPYFPLKRTFGGPHGGRAVGWEATPKEYIEHLVRAYREVRRILTKRGTVVVVWVIATQRVVAVSSRMSTRPIGWTTSRK